MGLDAGPVGGGAAGRNGGFLLAGLAAFHHDAAAALGRERATALHRATLAEMDVMEAETPAAIRRTGSLRISTSAAEVDDCAVQQAAMVADGLPVEPYTGPEGSGLRFPRDGSLQPLARCRALARSAVSRGAVLFEGSPAVEVTGSLVRTPSGAVRCGAVVVCVDGGLERLLPELNGRVRTARLQMLATAPTDEVSLPMPVYARGGLDYWQQLPDGRIALGGCRDAGGSAEWTGEAVVSAPVQAGLERLLREVVGVVRAPITHRWAGAVGFSDGVLPVLEEVRPGVVAVGGYSGMGNVVGSIWARAAVQLARDGAVADPAIHPA